jgi:hypothetical protein
VKNINRRATKNPAILLALHKEGFLAPTRGVGTRADGGERKEGFLDPMKPIGTRNDGRERKEGFLAGLKMTTGAFFAARGDEATDRSCCALKVLHHGGRDLKNEVGIHESLIATGLRLIFAKNPTKRPKTRVLIATKLAPFRARFRTLWKRMKRSECAQFGDECAGAASSAPTRAKTNSGRPPRKSRSLTPVRRHRDRVRDDTRRTDDRPLQIEVILRGFGFDGRLEVRPLDDYYS